MSHSQVLQPATTQAGSREELISDLLPARPVFPIYPIALCQEITYMALLVDGVLSFESKFFSELLFLAHIQC